MRIRRQQEIGEAELAALADESLPSERRKQVAARVDGSPELESRVAEQRRAVDLVRGAAAGVEAPLALRARVEAERRPHTRTLDRRLALSGGLAAAAAVAFVLALVLPVGAGGPSLTAAANLATRPATEAAPPLQPGRPTLLAESVDGVPFPGWEADLGWRATGFRSDRVDGHVTATVFYEELRNSNHRIAYTIVGGNPIEVPDDATFLLRKGTELRMFEHEGRVVVTWRRLGRTCVLSGDVPHPDVLLPKLASWDGRGSVPF